MAHRRGRGFLGRLAAATMCLVGCLCVAQAVAAPDEGGTTLDRLKEGYLAMESGDFEAALGHYRGAVETATTRELRFQANVGVGAAAAALGRSEEARHAYSAALALRPGHAPTLFSLAEVAEAEGRLDEAASLYAEVAVADPQSTEAFLRLGAVYAKQGRHQEAAAACGRVLEADPQNERALLCVGVARYHQGHAAEAAAVFESVVGRSPQNGNAWYGLGLSRLALKDQRGAVEAYAALKELDPPLADDLYRRIFPGS